MKKVYVIEIYPYLTEQVAAITATKIFSKRKDAEMRFSEDYLCSCRANDTTRKMPCSGDVIDMFAYTTASNKQVYYRLREMPLL